MSKFSKKISAAVLCGSLTFVLLSSGTSVSAGAQNGGVRRCQLAFPSSAEDEDLENENGSFNQVNNNQNTVKQTEHNSADQVNSEPSEARGSFENNSGKTKVESEDASLACRTAGSKDFVYKSASAVNDSKNPSKVAPSLIAKAGPFTALLPVLIGAFNSLDARSSGGNSKEPSEPGFPDFPKPHFDFPDREPESDYSILERCFGFIFERCFMVVAVLIFVLIFLVLLLVITSFEGESEVVQHRVNNGEWHKINDNVQFKVYDNGMQLKIYNNVQLTVNGRDVRYECNNDYVVFRIHSDDVQLRNYSESVQFEARDGVWYKIEDNMRFTPDNDVTYGIDNRVKFKIHNGDIVFVIHRPQYADVNNSLNVSYASTTCSTLSDESLDYE